MNKIDYDSKKFTKDSHGNLIPRKKPQIRVPGTVQLSQIGYWYIDRPKRPRILWKDRTWHDETGYDRHENLCDAPGWYRTRKEARDTLRGYKETQ